MKASRSRKTPTADVTTATAGSRGIPQKGMESTDASASTRSKLKARRVQVRFEAEMVPAAFQASCRAGRLESFKSSNRAAAERGISHFTIASIHRGGATFCDRI